MSDDGTSRDEAGAPRAALPSFMRPPERVAGVPTTTGVEIALVPATFGALGWWLDGRLGTRPGLLIGLLSFAVVGMFVKTWIGYDAAMRREEAGAPWAPRRPPSGPTDAVDGPDVAP